MLSRFFGNSSEKLVLSLLGDEEISAEELERLREAIRNASPDKGNAGERREISMPLILMADAIATMLAEVAERGAQAILPGSRIRGACSSRRHFGRAQLVAVALVLCLRLLPRISATHRFAPGPWALQLWLPLALSASHRSFTCGERGRESCRRNKLR